MKAEDYSERTLEVDGWEVHLTSYKLGDGYVCKVDNVSPGAWFVRTEGATKDEAEEQALVKARERLSKTRRHSV